MPQSTQWVVVTGANGGVGTATVEKLLDVGYSVIGADLQADSGRPENDEYLYAQVDVTSETSLKALGALIEERVLATSQHLQGAILCAGTVHSAPLLETSLSDWQRVMAVNAQGVFLSIKTIAQLMIRQNPQDPQNLRGIVTVSSNAARVPRYEFGIYGASKAAASRVSTSFGLQLAEHGIRVNVLCPGTTRTPMVTGPWQGENLAHLPIAGSPETYRLGIPLGRIAEPEDIADVAHFLLSPQAKHITMQELTADGGATF